MRLTDINLTVPSPSDNPFGRTILIGMLENGPVGQPFTLSEENDPIDYLGNTPATLAAQGLLNAGITPESIIYYRLNGTSARYNYMLNEEKLFDIVGISGHSRQNNVQVTFSPEGVTLRSNYLESDMLSTEENYLRTYRFDDYPYLSSLANAINQDAVLGLIDVIAREYKDVPTKGLFNTGIFNLDGGSQDLAYIRPEVWDEDTKSQYYELFYNELLGEGYEGFSASNIIDIPAEILLFPDLEIDEYKEIAPLASYIAQQKTEEQHSMCYALFHTGVVPYNDTIDDINDVHDGQYYDEELDEFVSYTPYVSQEAYVEKLLSLYTDDEQTYEYNRHLMIVVGNQIIDPFRLYPWGDLAVAILMLQSKPSMGLSNKPLTEFSLDNVLTPSMFARLTAKGYTCIVPSIRKGDTCQLVQSMELADRGTILYEWSNRRTFGEICVRLNNLLEGYIGRAVSYMEEAKVRRDIEDMIHEFVLQERVKSGRVEHVESFPNQQAAIIDISLVFNQEVRKIKGTIQVKKDGWDIDIWNLVD